MTKIKRWLKEYALPLLLVLFGVLEELTGAMTLLLDEQWAGYIQKFMAALTIIIALLKKLKIERRKSRAKQNNASTPL